MGTPCVIATVSALNLGIDFKSVPSMPRLKPCIYNPSRGASNSLVSSKIAIKNLAILQTGDLPAILRCRRIFALHRIGYIRLITKMASASSGSQLAGFPKNQSLFLGVS